MYTEGDSDVILFHICQLIFAAILWVKPLRKTITASDSALLTTERVYKLYLLTYLLILEMFVNVIALKYAVLVSR